MAFATEILEAVQADVKEQFKEAFVELKEALEVTALSLFHCVSLFLPPPLSRFISFPLL